jgi:hypothetical protein
MINLKICKGYVVSRSEVYFSPDYLDFAISVGDLGKTFFHDYKSKYSCTSKSLNDFLNMKFKFRFTICRKIF